MIIFFFWIRSNLLEERINALTSYITYNQRWIGIRALSAHRVLGFLLSQKKYLIFSKKLECTIEYQLLKIFKISLCSLIFFATHYSIGPYIVQFTELNSVTHQSYPGLLITFIVITLQGLISSHDKVIDKDFVL